MRFPLVRILAVLLAAASTAQSESVDPSAATAAVKSPSANRKPIVAVNGLSANGVDPSEAAALEDNLAAKLQQTGKVRVMERSQMDKILKEQSFQQSGSCDGGECAVEMGRILGIDQMIVGSVGLVGSTYTFNLRLVDVATGEAVRSSALTRRGTIDDVLTVLIPKAVTELTGDDKSIVVAAPPPVAPPPQAPVQASTPESKTAVWPWILGGAVVVGGGAVAAYLLLSDDGSSSPSPSDGGSSTTTVKAQW